MEESPTPRSRCEDLLRTGAIPPDSEDLVDFTVSLRGVEVGMLFIEQARGGVKVSFRARNGLDCSRLAAQFGGGGHREAAGSDRARADGRDRRARARGRSRQALESGDLPG